MVDGWLKMADKGFGMDSNIIFDMFETIQLFYQIWGRNNSTVLPNVGPWAR